MSKNNFLQIYDSTIKNAENFINSTVEDKFLKKYEAYSSSLQQLTQTLKIIKDKDDIKEEIDNVLAIHKRVEDRLISEKDSIFKNIRTTICREHVRHKYYSESLKSTLVDRQS